MFGKNQLLKRVHSLADEDGRYWVQEIFRTIQGEGPWTGMPSVFVRMAGCNLRCTYCDTDFESSDKRPTLDALVDIITDLADAGGKIDHVVITGGEPLRQPLGPLIAALQGHGFAIQIETAGSIWDDTILAPDAILWVCSPKTGKIHPTIEQHCKHLKYIVREGDADLEDGLPIMSTQQAGLAARLYRPHKDFTRFGGTVWVQPCEVYATATLQRDAVDHAVTRRNVRHAVDLCMKHGYRLSYQLHKAIGMP